MTEEIQTTKSDEEIFKDHIENLYQLFDPERKQSQDDLIKFSKQPIQALYVLLAFVINTKNLVELDTITDEFVERVILSFNAEDEVLLEKMISLDKQIKACCFSGKKFQDCALFFNIWSEILEQFIEEVQNNKEQNAEQEIEEIVQKTDKLTLD